MSRDEYMHEPTEDRSAVWEECSSQKVPKVELRRNLSGCKMILEGREEAEDSWQGRILAVNRVKGILSMSEEYLDNAHRYLYDVTSLQPFSVYCESASIHTRELTLLFEGILDTIHEAENYLLDSEHLLFVPEHLFISWEDHRIWAAWYPGYRRRVYAGLSEITEYLLRKIGCGDRETVVLACRFLHALEAPNVQFEDLRAVFAGNGDWETGDKELHRDREINFEPLTAREGASDEYREWREKKHDEEEIFGEKNRLSEQAAAGAAAIPVRKHFPERDTIRMALILTPVAAGLYFLLHFQNYVTLTTEESIAAGISLCAAVLCATVLTERRCRNHKERDQRVIKNVYKEENRFSDQEVIPSENARKKEAKRGKTIKRETEEFEKEYRYTEEVEQSDWEFLQDDFEERRDRENENSGETVLLSGYAASQKETVSWFLIPEQDNSGRSIELTGDVLLIGHERGSADLRLPDPTVSRMHARLTNRKGQWYLRDLNSRNGTEADGKKVVGTEEVPLTDGMKVSFGASRYFVQQR